MSSTSLNTGTWTQAEDDLLKHAVAKHGPRWVVVATNVGTRNGDQCAKRWNENLNPELDHSPWSAVEDKLLAHLVEMYGRNWTSLANRFFEKRPPLSLKNRMSYLERRQKREDRARTTQKKGTQSPYISVSPSASGSTAMSEAQSSVVTPDNDAPRHDTSRSSPSTNTGSDQILPSRWNSSSPKLPNFFSTLATEFNTKQTSPSNTHHELALDTLPDDPMFYMPDQRDIYGLMDSTTAFDEAATIDTSRAPGATLEASLIPAAYRLNSALSQGQSSSAGSRERCDDAVEYSLTCPCDKVKSLVQHLVDAAMPACTGLGVRDGEQVVLSLKLKKL